MSTPLTERQGADPAPSIPPLSCPFCGATYRLPWEAITRATLPLQALVCKLLSMLQQGQLAPGFSHEDWLAWLAKARRAVHLPASSQSPLTARPRAGRFASGGYHGTATPCA